MGKFFGRHDKNVTKIPISTPRKVIGTSEEGEGEGRGGRGGGLGLKSPNFLRIIRSYSGQIFSQGVEVQTKKKTLPHS